MTCSGDRMDSRSAREGTNTQHGSRGTYVWVDMTISQTILQRKIYLLHCYAEAMKRPTNFFANVQSDDAPTLSKMRSTAVKCGNNVA
jgi:hypothetical protein